MQIHVTAAEAYFYPDVSVSCNADDLAAEQRATSPLLIVEVSSHSTRRHDRIEKFNRYKLIAALREYVLIAAERRVTEVFARGDDGAWMSRVFSGDDAIEFTCVDFTLSANELYFKVAAAR
ncbi:hypothetical protein CDN99_17095 [Roseateles aquatilis]|uniref:Putative restriction endonuclease domain-containing protein n=1 Tax=Roseateles aquatilis TaxID=431061 RepID=A0A246J7F4_9BURK|nr:hypothetical protein CDN99_17095 [Roseateles aquatilis]